MDNFSDRAYQRRKTKLFYAHIAAAFFFLFVMSVSFSRSLQNSIESFTQNSVIVITLYTFFFQGFYFLFSLGLNYYDGYIIEQQFRGIRQAPREWFTQALNTEMQKYAVFMVIMQLIYFFLEADTNSWWLPVGGICSLVMCGRIFFKYLMPLVWPGPEISDPKILESVGEMAGRAHFSLRATAMLPDYFPSGQAALVNTGRGFKLFLSRDILSYAPEEIRVLTAREIAKYSLGSIWKIPLLRVGFLMLVFFLVNRLFPAAGMLFGFDLMFEVSTVPVLLALFFLVLLGGFLVQNGFLRRFQNKEDMFVLKLSRAPEAFISLLIRAGENERFGPAAPGFWQRLIFNPAAISERLSLAQDFAQSLLFEKKQRPDKKE